MAGITLGSIASGQLLATTRRVRGSGAGLVWLAAGLLPLGATIGALFPLVTVVAQVSVAPALLGIATASPVMFRSEAGALGVSAMFTLFEHRMATHPAFGDALSSVLWAAATVMALTSLAALALPAALTRPGAAPATRQHVTTG